MSVVNLRMNYGLMNVKARQRELILSKPKHKYKRYFTQKPST